MLKTDQCNEDDSFWFIVSLFWDLDRDRFLVPCLHGGGYQYLQMTVT